MLQDTIISIYSSIITIMGYLLLIAYCAVEVFNEIRGKESSGLFFRVAFSIIFLAAGLMVSIALCNEVVDVAREGFKPCSLSYALVMTILFVGAIGYAIYKFRVTNEVSEQPSKKEQIIHILIWSMIFAMFFVDSKEQVRHILAIDKQNNTHVTKVKEDEVGKARSDDVPFSGGAMNLTMPKAVVLLGAKFPKDVGPVRYVGTGVIIKKLLEGKERVLLLTARHVATTVISMRSNLELGVIMPDGIHPTMVSNRVWLTDEITSEDIAMLDLSGLGFEDCAIDFDGEGVVKIADDSDFESGRFKKGCKAFAVSGEVEKSKIALRPGWYLQSEDGMRVFYISSIHGNSGSPIFLYVDNTVYFAGILTLSLGEKQRLTAAEPLTNIVKLLERGFTAGYFDHDIREGQPGIDFSRGCELMKRKNVPHGYVGPSSNTWLLPHSFVSQGKQYKVVLKSHKSLEFNILDENDNIVVDGCRYLTMPSEFDARIHAFQFACMNRNLTMDEIEKRVRCKVTNGDISAVELVGVSGAYYYQKDVVLLLFRRPQGEGSTIAEDLVNAMRRDL